MEREVDEEHEQKIEKKSEWFVKNMLNNAVCTFNFDDPKYLLESAGYTKKGKLVDYEEIERFIDNLNLEELRLFLKIFINETHQATYHIPNNIIKKYIKDISEDHEVKT